MGSGEWTRDAFCCYSTSLGRSVTSDGVAELKHMSVDQVYKVRQLSSALNPFQVVRECCDSDEHPNTVPVILALDVTGSMGYTAVEVAAELNKTMTEIYKTTKDVEFLIMGIGDFRYDEAALQTSQFESDIRIAEQLDQLFFEGGGGPNPYESYTAAWCFATYQTKLDCWKRGKKGILITLGDEELNPYIPFQNYCKATGHTTNTDIMTTDLYPLVSDKYEVFHIDVDHRGFHPDMTLWNDTLGEDHVFRTTVGGVSQQIAEIVQFYANRDMNNGTVGTTTDGTAVPTISW